MSFGGAAGSENAGTSSDNPDENSGHRKSKVSYSMAVRVGLVGPKAKPKGVVDGDPVNIPEPSFIRPRTAGFGGLGGVNLFQG